MVNGGVLKTVIQMESEPPIVTALQGNAHPLLKRLIEKFAVFGDDPTFIVQVPGRVNLIGEHVDYCGYSVLPMALQQHILIAVKPSRDSYLQLANLSEKYERHDRIINDLSLDLSKGVGWHNYVLCGIRGISETLNENKQLCGMSMVIAGNVLPNAGLSSSSALVSAAALGTAYANKITMSRSELASVCAKCERYIGTEGGGMDQAIAFLAKAGCAKHISFNPLRATDVKLPAGVSIVVAHSLVEMNKAASNSFNCRVAECRLAALLLGHKSGFEDWRQVRVLADVQARLNMELSDMANYAGKMLTEEQYTVEEISSLLHITSTDLKREFLPENVWHLQTFKLHQRAVHVYQEAARVLEFEKVCCDVGDPFILGQLMNSSHDSLRGLFECSHPQLDELVMIARDAGALGARLTGAGWGGCIIALVTDEHAAVFIQSLKDKFYSKYGKVKDVDSLVFSSAPGHGACIIE